MKKHFKWILASASIGVVSSLASAEPSHVHTSDNESRMEIQGQPMVDYPTSAMEAISNWPENTKSAAMKIIEKYGQPDEISQSRLLWRNTGEWKRTEIFREPVLHLFPKKHYDYLKQTIDYAVPTEAFDDLALYDGSVTANRTQGELAARCHIEAANTLAINLAHRIITGDYSVEEARSAYGEAIVQSESGDTPDIMKELQFEVPLGDTADPDVSILPSRN